MTRRLQGGYWRLIWCFYVVDLDVITRRYMYLNYCGLWLVTSFLFICFVYENVMKIKNNILESGKTIGVKQQTFCTVVSLFIDLFIIYRTA